MAHLTQVLFVCLGNICRSPAAEGILRKQLDESQVAFPIQVASKGTNHYHQGALPDRRMREAARQRGYVLESRASYLSRQDLVDTTLFIAMDRKNLAAIKELAGEIPYHAVLLSHFLDDQWPDEVPDPYYGEEDGFTLVLDMIEAACPKIIAYLQSTRKED